MKNQYLILALILSLSACGFHLRGSQQKTSIHADNVYVTDIGAGELAAEVKLQLKNAGAKTAQAMDGARFVLRLERQSFDQTVLSVSAVTGKVEEYQLSLEVYMTMLDSSGKELISAKQIYLTRDYTFDDAAVLGKFEEVDVLRDEMLAQAASEIIRYLDTESQSR